jgi:phosphopentomutase
MKKDINRVFLIVLDSVGCGEMPDSADFGDAGSNTLKSISASKNFSADNMISLGLGNIDGIDYLPKIDRPRAAVARYAERSKGKDTTTGHWEIGGIVSTKPMPTYPDGFPREILDEFSRRTGRGVICNKPYSGTAVINDYGDEHVKTGDLIVYTSADSVFQVAAHEDLVSNETLYEYCRIAREILTGEHGVGRVIARPFVGSNGEYKRTANRRDFSLEPPKDTMLDVLKNNGLSTVAVGKIRDIFAGKGVTEAYLTHSNKEGMETALTLADKDFRGLCFINLVDFDMLYGHRNDVDGYAAAYAEFDAWLPSFLSKMREDDVLMITADHGCDPATESTDHSREYIPLVIYGDKVTPVNLGTRECFGDIAATICDVFGLENDLEGVSFADEIIR